MVLRAPPKQVPIEPRVGSTLGKFRTAGPILASTNNFNVIPKSSPTFFDRKAPESPAAKEANKTTSSPSRGTTNRMVELKALIKSKIQDTTEAASSSAPAPNTFARSIKQEPGTENTPPVQLPRPSHSNTFGAPTTNLFGSSKTTPFGITDIAPAGQNFAAEAAEAIQNSVFAKFTDAAPAPASSTTQSSNLCSTTTAGLFGRTPNFQESILKLGEPRPGGLFGQQAANTEGSIFKSPESRSQIPFQAVGWTESPTTPNARSLVPLATESVSNVIAKPIGAQNSIGGAQCSSTWLNLPKFGSPALSTPSPTAPFASKSAKKQAQVDYCKVVTIIVDKYQSRQDFVVHKAYLTGCSTFFKEAFGNGYQETNTQTMNLPDVCSAAFDFVVKFAYTKTLVDVEEGVPSVVVLYAQVWTLGERFKIPRLQNMALLKFHELLRSLDSWHDFLVLISHVYLDETTRDSPLRKLVAQKMAYGMRDRWVDDAGQLPSSFMVDVLAVLIDFHDKQPFVVGKGKLPALALEFYAAVED